MSMTSMKKVIPILCILITISCQLSAQSIKDIWISMPDSIVPYLTIDLKKELVNNAKLSIKAQVINLLGDTTKVDTASDKYMKVVLSKRSTLELIELDKNTIALLMTFHGPLKDSNLSLYSKDWTLIKNKVRLSVTAIKPSPMSDEEYDECVKLMCPSLRQIAYLPDENVFLPKYSFPLLSGDNKEKANSILTQTKYKWDGSELKKVK